MEATPAYAVIECGGVGYYINISVNTYSQIVALQQVSLYIHQIVREDALLLYGFFNKEERTVFRQLISVSGIGANTASVMLSSMTVKEIAGAILTENVNAIKSVKGIGLKTAQRVIIELKDKIAVTGSAEEMNFGASVAIKEEALAALVMLGFVKAQANKVLDKIMAGGGVTSVEELIKQALQIISVNRFANNVCVYAVYLVIIFDNNSDGFCFRLSCGRIGGAYFFRAGCRDRFRYPAISDPGDPGQ